MYVCVYVYIYTYTPTYIYMYKDIYIYVYIYIYIYIYICTYICIFIYYIYFCKFLKLLDFGEVAAFLVETVINVKGDVTGVPRNLVGRIQIMSFFSFEFVPGNWSFAIWWISGM